MKRIIVFEEKHGTRYFDVSTDELLGAVCLKILKERVKSGYFQPEEECKRKIEEYQKDIDAFLKLKENLKNTSATTIGTKKQKESYIKIIDDIVIYDSVKVIDDKLYALKLNLRREINNLEDAVDVTEAIEKNDGKIAYDILYNRIGYEYERFEITELERV